MVLITSFAWNHGCKHVYKPLHGMMSVVIKYMVKVWLCMLYGNLKKWCASATLLFDFIKWQTHLIFVFSRASLLGGPRANYMAVVNAQQWAVGWHWMSNSRDSRVGNLGNHVRSG
jgi:hypothetical protein